MRVAAAEGALRLGLLRLDGRPVAAQYLGARRRYRHGAQTGT